LAVVVIAIAFTLGWYFLVRPKSEVITSVSPSPVHVGDNYTISIIVTNRESQTITIQSSTFAVYADGTLKVRGTGPWNTYSEGIITDTIFSGETRTVFSDSATADESGTLRFELTLHTSIGDLKTTYELDVLP